MRRPLLVFMAMLMALCSFAQTKPVTGTVTDQRDGTPLAGVTVSVKGSPASTVTEPDGSFKLNVPEKATVLIFSGIGFQTVEMGIGNGIVNVQMQLSLNSLSEVVVTGYTAHSKRKTAGSSVRIVGDDIKLQPVGSFDRALQGKVPGVLSISSSGQPGAASEITIRGKGSINGSNTPLYVVDGIQISAADFATINPGDIESFNILKDATAASIYGSRGANGVIVITTKRGSAGLTKVNYDGQFGYSQLPENKLKVMNSAQKIAYEEGMGNPYGWSKEERDSLSKIDNGMKEALFQKGFFQQHMVSVTGGNDKTRFFLSGSLLDQEGVVRHTGLKRYTGRINLDHTTGNWKMGLNASFGYSRMNNTQEADTYVNYPLNAVRWFNPYMTLYDAEGNYQYDYKADQPNPLQELLENNRNNDQFKGIGSVYLEYQLPWIKGLRARTQWGADFTQDETGRYVDRTTVTGSVQLGNSGALSRNYTKFVRYTGTTSLTYQTSFGDHDISLGLFNEIVQAKQENFGFTGWGLLGPFKNVAGITAGTSTNGFIPVVRGGSSQNALLSYFFDGSYGYKNRYYLNVGARRDGSSRLVRDNRWSNFGHVGVSWIISDEAFMAGVDNWLSSLKLKASYGSVGSQGIGDFESLPLLSSAEYNGASGLVLTSLGTPITWEKKRMFNTGMEFSLFNGRVSGSAEYYNNLTVDLFLARQLSRTSGFYSVISNLGRLRNSGLEFALNANLIQGKDFNWSVFGNFTYNKNEIVNLGDREDNINGMSINKVGYAANSHYLVRSGGVDAQTGKAVYYTATGDTTHNFSRGARQIVGRIDPPYFGGFGTTVSYKGMELNVQFSYAWGNKVFNNDRTNIENSLYWFSNLSTNMLNEWREPGQITDVPSAEYYLEAETTRFLEKGDFLRLQNVMLSYQIAKRTTEKLKIRSARFFVQGQNLFVWHNVQSYDPETPGGSLIGAKYPQLKTITFGVNLGL